VALYKSENKKVNSPPIGTTQPIRLTIDFQQKKKYLRKQILAYIFASIYLLIMETRRDVFQAIADPTRRAIIGMIAREAVNVNTIAEKFDVSRQAISLHLKVLSECGLLNIQQLGRERICELKLEKLNEVHEWVEQYHKLWTGRLKDLKTFVEQEELQHKKIVNRGKSVKKTIHPKNEKSIIKT